MLKHLTLEEMTGVIEKWVVDPDRKAIFLSIAEIAAIHPKAVRLHAELLAIRPVATAPSPAMRAVLAGSVKADGAHDVLARAVSAGIEADRAYSLAARPPQVERARQAESVHGKLFPSGLAIVNVSYLAESANTSRMAALLGNEPAIADYLEGVPVRDDGTLLDMTKRWIASGKKLGKLEREREVLEVAETPKPPGSASIAALRARWLRLVSQVLSNLELSDAPDDDIKLIRDPVQLASERAGLRYANPAAAPTDVTPPPAGPQSLTDASAVA